MNFSATILAMRCCARPTLKKLFLVMRLTTFFLLIALLHASASSLAQQVTLHEKQASMQKVLSDIEKQSGYNVFYGDQVLQNIPLVDIDLNNVP
jgi:hypothetical protein